MHNLSTRLISLVMSWLFCVAVLSFLAAMSTYFHFPKPVSEFTDVEVTSLHHVPGTRFNFDEANLLITVDADLSSVFNWNVKQLFVYVVAEYTSSTGTFNQMVLWDDIIQSREDAKFSAKAREPDYKFYDLNAEMSEVTLNISLNWDCHPNVGSLHQHRGSVHTLTLPKATKLKGRY